MRELVTDILRLYPKVIATTGTIATLSAHDASCLMFTGAGAVTVESISFGARGKILKVINLTGSTLTLKHNTGSVAKNRILLSTAADLVLSADMIVTLIYDHVNSRWKVEGGASGGGGGTETTRQFVYTSSPVNSNEYSSFAALHAAATAFGFPCEIILKQNLTISTGNDWDFTNMVFVGNGSAISPKTFTIEDSTGAQATFNLTAVSATPADYFEQYVSVYDDENSLAYIWFDSTGADPEPPAIIAATELKVKVDVSAIASADDVATAIAAAVAGNAFLNSKYTVVPTAAVAAVTLNFNGVSTIPVSSTANITVGSFVAGVLGTTLLSNTTLHLKHVFFDFKDYTAQRAWKVTTPQALLFVDATGAEGSIGYCAANSTNCTIAPILIKTGGSLAAAQSGFGSILNVAGLPFIELDDGTLQLYPLDSLFGFGSSGNITGSLGSVTVRYGLYYPQTPRSNFTLGGYTGGLTTYPGARLDLTDVDGVPSAITQPDALIVSGGFNNVQEALPQYILGIGNVLTAYADSNINIATLQVGDSIDSQFLVNSRKVYLGGQTNPVENGVYIVHNAGPATRDPDFIVGTLYKISGGDVYGQKWVKNTNLFPFTIDTDPVTQEITSLVATDRMVRDARYFRSVTFN